MRHGASPEIEIERETEVETEKGKESEGESRFTRQPLKTSSKQAREKLDHLATRARQQAIAILLDQRYPEDEICRMLETDQETIRLVERGLLRWPH